MTKYFLFLSFYLLQVTVQAWEIDLSRRQVDFQRIQNYRMPTSTQSVEVKTTYKGSEQELLDTLRKAQIIVSPSSDIVIMQTAKGFVPEKIELEKGHTYNIYVVNLNPYDKNVSFLMDSFSQAHNTVYGVPKNFQITPKVNGTYTYQSPETGVQGLLTVVDKAGLKQAMPPTEEMLPQKEISVRSLASDK